MQVIIDTRNTKISVKNQCFFIENKITKRIISPKRISSLALLNNVWINNSAIKLAAINQIPILYFDNTGHIQARLWSPYFVNLASLRKQQFHYQDSKLATQWVITGLKAKLNAQVATLLQLGKMQPAHQSMIKETTQEMNTYFDKLTRFENFLITDCRNALMGVEGNISKIYWSACHHFLPSAFQFSKRSRRPAQDKFNAALNYLYGMTYSVVENAVFATGLDPMISFLHVEGYQRPSLVFDMIEPFRPLVDRLLIRICREQLLEENHFNSTAKGVWMGKPGKRVIIPLFNEYLRKTLFFQQKYRTLKDHIFAYSQNLTQSIKSVEERK